MINADDEIEKYSAVFFHTRQRELVILTRTEFPSFFFFCTNLSNFSQGDLRADDTPQHTYQLNNALQSIDCVYLIGFYQRTKKINLKRLSRATIW